MDDYWGIVGSIAVFMLFVVIHYYKKHTELVKNVLAVQKELCDDHYAIEYYWDAGENTRVYILTNSISRIVLTERRDKTELLLKQFFEHREGSGANVVELSRSILGIKKWHISWKKHHYLLGRMLYNRDGITPLREMHRLFNNIVLLIHEHAEGKRS